MSTVQQALVESQLKRLRRQRAKAVALGAGDDLLVPMDTVIGSLARMRTMLAEGRLRDVEMETAAVKSATDQLMAKGI